MTNDALLTGLNELCGASLAPAKVHPSSTLKSPSEVTSHEDLPPTLFMGNIQPESYSESAEQWQCRWGTSERSYLNVRFDIPRGNLFAYTYWHGLKGGIGAVHATGENAWEQLGGYLFPSGLPEAWAHEWTRLNPGIVFAKSASDTHISGFPDGLLAGLIVRVKPSALLALLENIRRTLSATGVSPNANILGLVGYDKFAFSPGWMGEDEVKAFLSDLSAQFGVTPRIESWSGTITAKAPNVHLIVLYPWWNWEAVFAACQSNLGLTPKGSNPLKTRSLNPFSISFAGMAEAFAPGINLRAQYQHNSANAPTSAINYFCRVPGLMDLKAPRSLNKTDWLKAVCALFSDWEVAAAKEEIKKPGFFSRLFG